MRSNKLFSLHGSIFFLTLLLLQFQLFAQTVSFNAESNAQEVVVGNSFTLTFRLDNADIRNIDFPDFDKAGFKVLQGPYNETRYSNVNGKKSTSESYVFELSPKKEGELTIGPSKVVTSRGKVMKSKSLTIKAVKSNTGSYEGDNNSNLPPAIAGKVLFKMVVDKKEATIGEQIEVNFKLYTQIDLMNIEFAKEPEFKGFNVKYRPVRDYDAQIEVVNGRQYAVKTIYSTFLYPQKAGNLKIDPAVVNIVQGSLNYYSNPKVYTISSNKLNIDVISLNKTPKYFSGAVGNFSMKVEVEKTIITTDNIVKMDVIINGIGDANQINEVKIFYPKHKTEPFETFPPKITELQEVYSGFGDDKGGDKKKFQYKLNPLATGEFVIKPTFIYYDSKKRKFVTLDTTIVVRVSQGKKKLAPLVAEITESEDLKKKYSFGNIVKKASWTSGQRPLFGSMLFWLVTSLPFLVLAFVFSSRFYFQQRLLVADRKKQQNKVDLELNEKMILVKQFLDNGEQHAFYENLSMALKSYFSAKLNIQSGDFNNKSLSDSMLAGNADEFNVKRLLNVLNVCEQAVYAAQNNDTEMQRVFSETKDLLNYYAGFFKKS